MRIIQIVTWVTLVFVTLVAEFLFRVCLFPIGVVLTILATICGASRWVSNNHFLDYCTPWKVNTELFVIAKSVSDWMDPDC